MNRRQPAVLLLLLAIFVLPSCGPKFLGQVRTPTFNYVKESEGGCADVYLHKGTADNREVLWISANKEKLKLPDNDSKTFNLADAPDSLRVAVDLWDKAPRFSAYCNDISPDTKREATWKAKKGTITLTLHPTKEGEKERPRRYKASARLDNVTFEDDAGHQATLKNETITEVLVGWYAG
ncbi:MAG TPA: hypothetical protein VH643_10460 [Gemmataceae bacterium]|jgi:hypothetical protein